MNELEIKNTFSEKEEDIFTHFKLFKHTKQKNFFKAS